MSIKKDIFAPLVSGLGATRRAAMTLLVMLLTATTAWAQTTSTINVGGTDYTLFTGFTATDGNGNNWANLVDGNTSTDWIAEKTRPGEPDPDPDAPPAPTGDFAGGTEDPAFVEFHADAPIIPKGYVLTCDHENAGFWKPVEWALKAKLNEGDAWTTIQSSTTTLGQGKTFEIACDNDGDNEYQYFRFEVYEVGTTMTVDLDELQFYGLLPAYTHLTVKAATCMATGIKVDCYRRNSDGKYFTDETGATELAESDVIAPMIPHSGEHHEATDVNIEYWQCSMCGKYFSDSGYTTEITEEQTKIYRTITIDSSISGLVTVAFSKTQALAGESIILYVDYQVDASTLKVNDGAVELTAKTDIQYTFTMPAADVTVTAEVAQSNADGDVLTGSIRHTVTIPHGASITLNNATITGSIVCEGSATITLVGTNSVSGATNKAGIQVGGSGTTLTIRGDGSLTVTGGDQSAGIGLNRAWNVTEDVVGGNIVINGGNITANGGGGGAGIGAGVTKDPNNSSSRKAIVGTITIAGGSVTAVGGSNADGIGAGENNYNATIQIGTVTIYDDIDKVDASSIKDFNNVIYIHGETNVTANKTDYFAIGEDGNRRLIVQKPVIADIPDQTYTGSAITPEPTVIAGSLSLTKGTDYVYSYTNNTNFGTAKVRATFQGTYASLGYVEKEFTILPPPVVVNVTGNGTVTYNDKVATNGEVIGVVADKGTDVTLTLAPESGYAVSIEYGYTRYTNSSEMTINGAKLPINGTTATLTVPDDLKDGTYVNLTVTFVSALAGGADEASAVALTDATVTDLGGGWYKVDSNITFDHTLHLLGDTHLIIADGKTMTVNTATSEGILSDYTLFVSGEGTLSVATTGDYGIAVCVGNYVQTGATVTASGYIGIRCKDDFLGFDFDNDFTFSGGQLTATGSGGGGIDADNDITLSCTNATDFIQASSYTAHGAVKIADGKALTDGTEASNGMNGYSGTLTNEQRITIGGKTLHRAVITSYVEASGTLHENVIAIPLDNTMTTLAAGWYVVNENVDYTGQITLSGDVTLILGDGKAMTVTNTGTDVKDRAIYGDEKTLHIYGQSQGTGALTATAVGGESAIFLETSHDNAGSLLGIHGGVVSASTECASGVAISVQCATDAGGIVIDGGQVTASGKSYGIFCFSGHFDVIGGQVTATGTNGYGLGICDYGINPGVLTLGYSKASDFVSTNSIYNYSGDSSAGEVKIADDQTLVDGNGNIWSGTLSNNEIQSIHNQTLRPVTGVALTKDGNNVSATFNGSSETTLSIPVDVNVTSVTYERTFTDDRPATVMLPFSLGEGQTLTGGTLYKFTGVTKNETTGMWEATMTETATLQANTPYLLMPDNELTNGKVTFNLNWGTVKLNTTGGGNCETADEGSHWTFKGTYEYMKWTDDSNDPDYNADREAEIGRAYGFAGVAKTDIEVGDFVRAANGAKIRPMGCYLLWSDTPNAAPARKMTRGASVDELPSRITVRLVGSNGEVTSIGEIDTTTGEMTFDSEAWYTLDGVRLSGKPTKKGLYINNGRKVVIK